jgi:hypothetical protein
MWSCAEHPPQTVVPAEGGACPGRGRVRRSFSFRTEHGAVLGPEDQVLRCGMADGGVAVAEFGATE